METLSNKETDCHEAHIEANFSHHYDADTRKESITELLMDCLDIKTEELYKRALTQQLSGASG